MDFYLGSFQAYDNSSENETKINFILQNYRNKKFYYLEGYANLYNAPTVFVYYTGLVLQKFLTWSRVFFISYFIGVVVENQCLALFYVFLQPRTMPQFAKNVYYQAMGVVAGGQSEL